MHIFLLNFEVGLRNLSANKNINFDKTVHPDFCFVKTYEAQGETLYKLVHLFHIFIKVLKPDIQLKTEKKFSQETFIVCTNNLIII